MADLPDGTPERYACAACGEGGLGLYGHYRIVDGIGRFTCQPPPVVTPPREDAGREG